MQLTTKEAWEVKELTDKIYEKWRNFQVDNLPPDIYNDYLEDLKLSKTAWNSLDIPRLNKFTKSSSVILGTPSSNKPADIRYLTSKSSKKKPLQYSPNVNDSGLIQDPLSYSDQTLEMSIKPVEGSNTGDALLTSRNNRPLSVNEYEYITTPPIIDNSIHLSKENDNDINTNKKSKDFRNKAINKFVNQLKKRGR
ncbi:MAG: hypothetical protein WBO70_08210 [Erysipelotrichaceae bacterium]